MRTPPDSTASRCNSRLSRSLLALAVLLILPATAATADLEYELGLSVLRSDNIDLAPTDGISETVVSPSVRFTFDQRGSRVSTTARGSVAYLDYASNAFDNDVRGELAGELTWSVVPKRIDFVVNDYLNRQPVSILTSFNPGNQQQVNVFIAGPTFHARTHNGFRGQLDLRYANSYAETSDSFNGNHYNAAARVLRDTSANQSVSLNVESTHSAYQDDANDYTRNDAYIGYSLMLASLDVTATVGYSQLQFDDARKSRTEPLGRASVNWTASARSRVVVVVRQGFSNAVQDVINRTTDLDGSIINELTSNDVLVGPGAFRQQEVYVAYHFDTERTAFHFQPYYQRSRAIGDFLPGSIDPADPDLDALANRENHGALFAVDYRVSPRSTLSFLLAHDVNRIGDVGRTDRSYIAALSFANRLSRNWSWRADLQRRQRDSSATGASYDENALVLSIAYLR